MSSIETASDIGMLNTAGSSIPCQMLIWICSIPNVRSMPANRISNAHSINPT